MLDFVIPDQGFNQPQYNSEELRHVRQMIFEDSAQRTLL